MDRFAFLHKFYIKLRNRGIALCPFLGIIGLKRCLPNGKINFSRLNLNSHFIYLIAQGKPIAKRGFLVVWVSQNGGRVISAHHQHAVFLNKFAVLFRYLKIG